MFYAYRYSLEFHASKTRISSSKQFHSHPVYSASLSFIADLFQQQLSPVSFYFLFTTFCFSLHTSRGRPESTEETRKDSLFHGGDLIH